MITPITKNIAYRLEELAVKWKDHTSQAEALMMAAKEVMTFEEQEKEQAYKIFKAGQDSMEEDAPYFDELWETFGGNK